jgi:hypothetical protein
MNGTFFAVISSDRRTNEMMPTDPFCHLNTYIHFLGRIRPSSLLDIGMGHGKLGFLARDLLDVTLGQRYKKEKWRITIDGIEIFAEYIQDHQKDIYDEIYIGDALDIIGSLGNYDVIVLGDVLGHLNKKTAVRLFDKCIEHSNQHIIIFTPLGETRNQGETYGNPHEKQLSVWHYKELEPFVESCEVFHLQTGPYGGFLIKKEGYIDHRIGILKASTPKVTEGNA